MLLFTMVLFSSCGKDQVEKVESKDQTTKLRSSNGCQSECPSLILNGDFSDHPYLPENAPILCQNNFANVANWQRAFGNPHLKFPMCCLWENGAAPNVPDFANFYADTPLNSIDGIKTDVGFKNDPNIEYSLCFKGTGKGVFNVALTKNFSGSNITNAIKQVIFDEVLGGSLIPCDAMVDHSVTFVADRPYNQIVFYQSPNTSGQAESSIDDISLSCKSKLVTGINVVKTGCSFTFSPIQLPGFQGLEYIWTFGDGTSATGQTVSHTYANFGQYIVKLTIKDANGCCTTLEKGVGCVNPVPGDFELCWNELWSNMDWVEGVKLTLLNGTVVTYNFAPMTTFDYTFCDAPTMGLNDNGEPEMPITVVPIPLQENFCEIYCELLNSMNSAISTYNLPNNYSYDVDMPNGCFKGTDWVPAYHLINVPFLDIEFFGPVDPLNPNLGTGTYDESCFMHKL